MSKVVQIPLAATSNQAASLALVPFWGSWVDTYRLLIPWQIPWMVDTSLLTITVFPHAQNSGMFFNFNPLSLSL